MVVFKYNRERLDITFNYIINEALNDSEKISIAINILCIISKQKSQADFESDSVEQYYKISLLISYLDLLIMSLTMIF